MSKYSSAKKIIIFNIFFFIIADFTAAYFFHMYKASPKNKREYRIQQPYGHSLKANVTTTDYWGKTLYSIKTNSLGFRDKAVRDIPLRSDKYRVVFIGDSFSEGLGIEYEKTFVGIIDDSLQARGVVVLNASVGSYSPHIFYKKMKYLIEEVHLEFDELVCMIDISDILDDVYYHEGSDQRNIDYLKKKETEKDIYQRLARGIKDWLSEHSLIYIFIRTIKRDNFPRIAFDLHRSLWTVDDKIFELYGRFGVELTQKNMTALYTLLESKGIKLSVVVYPWPDQIYYNDLDSKQVKIWKDWTKKHPSEFINCFPYFIDGSDPRDIYLKYFILDDAHWNKAGHRLIADIILKEKNLTIPR